MVIWNNNIENGKRMECYLVSKKVNPNSDKKLPYVSLIYKEPETNQTHYFFINDQSRIWDRKHRRYSILFSFFAPVGFVVEFRDKPGYYSKKKYFLVVDNPKNFNLLHISQFYAIILAKKLGRKMAKNNRNFRRIPADVRLQVFYRDNGCCVNCGSNLSIEYDHIIPFSLGGSNSVENVQVLCKRCNRLKSNNIVIPYPNRKSFPDVEFRRKKNKRKKFAY